MNSRRAPLVLAPLRIQEVRIHNRPMPLYPSGRFETLGPEGALLADVLISAVSRWSFSSRELAFSLDLPEGTPEKVSAHVLASVGRWEGFTARWDGEVIRVERDRESRRPYGKTRKR